MERRRRVRVIWGLAGAMLAVAAIVVPLLVLAGSGQATLTAETYADVIRFGVQGAATLRIQIYDLSEKEIWDSGVISSDFIDWDRTDTWGERLANGYYLYLVQAWDTRESLILSKTGKVALLLGDQVQLQAAPAVQNPGATSGTFPIPESPLQTMGLGDVGVFKQVGIGIASPSSELHIYASWPEIKLQDPGTGSPQMSFLSGGSLGGFFLYSQTANSFRFGNYKAGGDVRLLTGGNYERMTITGTGNVGIGTTSPEKRLHVSGDGAVTGALGVGTTNVTDKLTIEGATGNLIACYPSAARAPGSAVFRVESDGDTYADGSVYAADFITTSGGADVAERINASEWIEAGNVVEIDPEHPGFFRKSAGAYSSRVAGIISTSPGVVLGQRANPESDPWDDTRPVLAIAGRVPVKVTTENGPISVGDLLVASSTPGVAMKGDPSTSIGCVVGKAMEPFAEGEGVVMAQVMLR